MGILALLIAILAIRGFISVVRNLGPLLHGVLRNLFRVICKTGSLVRFAERNVLAILFNLASIIVLVMGGVLFAIRKAGSFAISALQKTSDSLRDPDFVRERVPQENPQPENRQNRFPKANAIAWCWIAPVSVLAVFVALSGTFRHEWDRILSVNQMPKSAIRKASRDEDRLPDNTILISDQSPTKESDLAKNRPQWIAEGDTTSGDVRRIVLSVI